MKTFEALQAVLFKSGEERPLILAIEDLHWMTCTGSTKRPRNFSFIWPTRCP